MRRFTDIVLALFLTALFIVAFGAAFGCGDGADSPRTFEDASSQLAVSWCEARDRCGLTVTTVEDCIAINEAGLCDVYDCDKDLTEEQSDVFDQCSDDFESWDCSPFLPQSCYEAGQQR